jgi:hypothetical protein
MPNLLRSLWMIINYKTLIITVISVIAIYTCKYFNFVGDLPITFDEEELQVVLRSEFVEDVGRFKKAQGI